MKNSIFIILLIFASLTSSSQDIEKTTDHLKFMGISIDGTLNEFVIEMTKKGFDHINTENEVAILKGDFAGYKECVIGIVTLKGKDLVSRVTVIFPDCDTWSDLSSDYFHLKNLLTEKYKEPSEVIEKFDSDFQPENDKDKMYELGMNNCSYFSSYEMQNGTIQISIDHKKFYSSYVSLMYIDKTNDEFIREKIKGDL